MASLPSDLGEYSDDGYVLPPLRTDLHVVDVDVTDRGDALTLFRLPELNATSVHAERRRTALARASAVAKLVAAEPDEQWLIWCETDYEADALLSAVPGLVDVHGSESPEAKERKLLGFADGQIKRLLTKPKLAGMGLNFQSCARVAFVGATFSFEAYYQAIRRAWRYGQQRDVHVHVVMGQTERAVWEILARKAADFDSMKREMFLAARRARQQDSPADIYTPTRTARLPRWINGCA